MALDAAAGLISWGAYPPRYVGGRGWCAQTSGAGRFDLVDLGELA